MKKLLAIIVAIALGYVFAYFFVGQNKGYKFIPGVDDFTDFQSLYENFKEKQKQNKLDKYNKKFNEGLMHFSDEDYWWAADVFEELYIDYGTPEALYWLGRSEYADGYFSTALDYFEELLYDVADDGSFDSAYFYLAKAYYQEDEYDDALDAFQNYLNEYPDDVVAMDWCAWAYYMIDEYDSAYVYEQKAIELDPEYADAYYALAHFKLYYALHEDLSKSKQKNLLKEIVSYNWKTLSLDSEYYDAFYDNGKAYYYLKNYDSAAFYLEEYFNQYPTDKYALGYLIDIYSQKKDMENLARIADIADKELTDDDVEVDSLIALAQKYQADNLLEKEDYETAIEIYYTCYTKTLDPNYLLDLANAYKITKDTLDAIDAINKFLDETDDDNRRQEALQMLQDLDDEL